MEIVWVPKHEIKVKFIIALTDNRCFKKDVSLIFKSIDSTNSKAGVLKPKPNQKAAKPIYGKPIEKLKLKKSTSSDSFLRQPINAIKPSDDVVKSKQNDGLAGPKLPLRGIENKI